MQEDNTMGMRVNAELPLPADLKNEYPLSDKLKAIKAKRDEEIRDIFTEIRQIRGDHRTMFGGQ